MSPSTSSGVRLLAPMMRSMSLRGSIAALVAHRRQVQALVEHLARLAGAASRHRAADVALVRDRSAEAEQLAVDEHRAQHAHVGRVRAAAVIGMVDQEGVALGDVVAELRDHRAAAGRERADMQRQHHMLRDHFALGVHQRAGGILRFAHDGGEAGAEQRVLHLPHDAGEARLHHFKIDGVDVHGCTLHVMPGPCRTLSPASLRDARPDTPCHDHSCSRPPARSGRHRSRSCSRTDREWPVPSSVSPTSSFSR